MQVRDYDFLNNIDVLFEKNIIIYGAGKYGKKCAQLLDDAGLVAYCFCDRNESLKEYMGHRVLSLNGLEEKAKQEDCIIIIGSRDYCEEMIEELDRRQIDVYTITWYGLQAGIEINVKDERFSKVYQDKLIRKKEIYTSHWLMHNDVYFMMALFTSNHEIIVYHPNKVGNTTVLHSLRKAGLEVSSIGRLLIHERLEALDELASFIVQDIRSNKRKIITLVREPISRSLGNFMQEFHDSAFIVRHIEVGCELSVSALRFMLEEEMDTNWEFVWFDEELKKTTGIDIYQYPFDKEKGYAWIKEGNIEILVLKLEKLNQNEAVLGEFVGQPGIKLYNANVGDKKYYKYIYEELKKRIRIPARVLEEQFKNNPKMDHFYTEEEKKQFWMKWEKNVVPD